MTCSPHPSSSNLLIVWANISVTLHSSICRGYTYYHFTCTNQRFGTTKLITWNGKRHRRHTMRIGFLEPVPPSTRLCIMKLHKLFYNTMVVCTSMHADTKASNKLHPLHQWRHIPCGRAQPLPQPSPQPQRWSLLNSTFIWRVRHTFGPATPPQIPGLDQLWNLVDHDTERETQDYNTSRLLVCVD